MGLGPMELVIILILALIVLGPGKLPDAGRAVGKAFGEFKRALNGNDDDAKSNAKTDESKPV
ncbi:MAG TPA: twin-arginine translocase TatA/TatE family subunit [Limnochordia bacterium]|nr:twin-arginine translocase TatA/TatE family subunit [Limnochordia bacterium]